MTGYNGPIKSLDKIINLNAIFNLILVFYSFTIIDGKHSRTVYVFIQMTQYDINFRKEDKKIKELQDKQRYIIGIFVGRWLYLLCNRLQWILLIKFVVKLLAVSWLMFNKGNKISLEKNHQVIICSNQICNRRNYSLVIKQFSNNEIIINPWWVTGFIDGEGSFIISLFKNKGIVGWEVKLIFQVELHKNDIKLTEDVKNFFETGKIYEKREQSAQFRIESQKKLLRIIDHFDKFPLRTQKHADYKLFKEAFNIVLNKEHLTMQGLLKIVAIKASMNLGLSDKLKAAFPNVVPVERSLIKDQIIIDFHWLIGFTAAEGCFMVHIKECNNTRLKPSVQLTFVLTQHLRDEQLLRSFIKYFNCGKVYKYREACDFRVYSLSDIITKIIPFYKGYPLGEKSKDFNIFCQVAEIMKERKHLTKDGLKQIRKLKEGMNRGKKK